MRNGVFIVAELFGPLRERVADIQREFDPKLARVTPPHVTLIGSSGAGPARFGTTAAQLIAAIAPIAADTPPIPTRFLRPLRFMQTQIVVLPLDVHGPLRTLHERIATSGLEFERARFTFYPHCTLSFYPTITAHKEQRLLALRMDEPFTIERIQCYETRDPLPSKKLAEFALTG